MDVVVAAIPASDLRRRPAAGPGSCSRLFSSSVPLLVLTSDGLSTGLSRVPRASDLMAYMAVAQPPNKKTGIHNSLNMKSSQSVLNDLVLHSLFIS